jgi:hypothetical protein
MLVGQTAGRMTACARARARARARAQCSVLVFVLACLSSSSGGAGLLREASLVPERWPCRDWSDG